MLKTKPYKQNVKTNFDAGLRKPEQKVLKRFKSLKFEGNLNFKVVLKLNVWSFSVYQKTDR